MGNHQSHGLHQQVIASLKKETDFNVCEISDLYRQFRVDCKDLAMTSTHFVDMYKAVYPHGDPENLAVRIFSTFDQQKTGQVDFHEFLCALSILLKGNTVVKLNWVYNVIDMRNRGKVDTREIKEIIEVLEGLNAGLMPDDFQSIDSLYSGILSEIGTDPSSISNKDFVNACLQKEQVRAFSDAVIKAALMPYEMRRERTGSYGRARTESIRARAMSQSLQKDVSRMRHHTVS